VGGPHGNLGVWRASSGRPYISQKGSSSKVRFGEGGKTSRPADKNVGKTLRFLRLPYIVHRLPGPNSPSKSLKNRGVEKGGNQKEGSSKNRRGA